MVPSHIIYTRPIHWISSISSTVYNDAPFRQKRGNWFAITCSVPVAALLLINTGLMLAMLGLIADQVSQTRLEQLDVPDSDGAGRRSTDRDPAEKE